MRHVALGVLIAGLAVGCAHGSGKASNRNKVPVAPVAVSGNTSGEGVAPEDIPVAHGPWVGGAGASGYSLIGSSEQLLGVWVDVPQVALDAHVPMSVTLAIDTSGSMRGEKIVQARRAARKVIDGLGDGDVVSIITFSDSASLLLRPTTLDMRTRRTAHNVIEELHAQGGTALHDGLNAAERLQLRAPETHLVRRVVVVSDGKATVGPTSPHQLGALAESGMQNGVQVTSLGVGLDYDESTLNALAVKSSGRLYHLADATEMAGIIESEISLLQSTAAADALVEVVPAPGVQLLGVDAVRSGWGNRGALLIPLGAMFAGQQREFLIRARFNPMREGTRALASLRLIFKDPANGGVERIQEAVVSTKVTDDPALVREHPHSRAQSIIAMGEAASLAIAASEQANAGNFAFADRDLGKAEQELRQQAAQSKRRADKDKMLRTANRLRKARSGLKKASKKKSKADMARGARAGALEANDAAMDARGF